MDLLMENEQEKVALPDGLIEKVEQVIVKTLESEGVTTDLEISLLVVGDDEIRQMNHEFRGKDKATDVLSFPMYESPEELEPGNLLGDIVISAERALEQSVEYGHSFEREFCFLVVHSMLHLLGYDHETSPEDELQMRAKEEKILLELGLARS